MKNGWGQHTDALDLRNRSLVVGYSFINVYFFFDRHYFGEDDGEMVPRTNSAAGMDGMGRAL